MMDEDDLTSGTLSPSFALMAVQILTRKQQNEVAVAVRRPRARNSCIRNAPHEDTNQWELILYSFSDCNQLSTPDNLLVQVAPSECLVVDSDTEPTSKALRQLLQAHSTCSESSSSLS